MFKILFILIITINIMYCELIRNNDDFIILNTNTFLMFQDNSESSTLELTWEDAITYCESNVSLGGYTDWRMPNINELVTIIDINKSAPTIDTTFLNIDSLGGIYWSSTTYARTDYTYQAWSIDFTTGNIKVKDKTENAKIRCVRDFK